AALAGMSPPADTEDFRAARTKAFTYLATALKALKPDAKLPPDADAAAVRAALELMREHAGFAEALLFHYDEDFSQYVPRGHYTRSETLKKYFMGMMWLGRMTFLIKGDQQFGSHPGDKALVSVPESCRQTLAAALLTKLLDQAKLPDGRKARDV